MNARKGKRGGAHSSGSMRPHSHGGDRGGPRGSGGERGERHHGHAAMINDRSALKDPFSVDGVYSNPHLMFASTSLVGCTTRVQLRSGKCWEGVLKCFSPKFEMVLDYAHEIVVGDEAATAACPSRDKIIDKLVIQPHDIVTVSATAVDLDFARDVSSAGPSNSSSFTDGAISGHKLNGGDDHPQMHHHRGVAYPPLAPLQPWDADEDDDICLDADGESLGWDPNEMFRANAERFGVESSYDSSLEQYTMPLLPKNSEEFKKREEVARKLAEEIESSSTYKDRIALENDEGDVDEEDKFSAVVRPESASSASGSTPTNSTGKYIPPAKRDRVSPAAAIQSGERGGGGGRGGRNSSDRHVSNSPHHREYTQAPHHHRDHPPQHGYHGRSPYGGGSNGGRQSSPRAAVGSLDHAGVSPSSSSSSKGFVDEAPGGGGGGGRIRRPYEGQPRGPHPRKSSYTDVKGSGSSHDGYGSSSGQSSLNTNGATASGGPSADASPSSSSSHGPASSSSSKTHLPPQHPPPSSSQSQQQQHHHPPPPQQLIPPISVITSHPAATPRQAPISYSAAVASPTGSAGGRSPVPPASAVTPTNQSQPSPSDAKVLFCDMDV